MQMQKISRLTLLLKKICKFEFTEVGSIDNHSTAGEGLENHIPGKSYARLPKLNLTKYYGDPKKFQEFFEQFQSAIGNSSLSGVEKFIYLRNLLCGDAARSIDGLAATEKNYESALEILRSRFGDRQVIINLHMNELMMIDTVKNAYDVKKLRMLHDRAQTAIRSLEGMGVTQEMFGALLVPILLKKLPEEIRVLINRAVSKRGAAWTIQELQIELQAEITAREKSDSRFSEISRGYLNQRARLEFERGGKPITSEVLVNNSTKIVCALCDGDHFSDKCDKFSDLKSRKSRISERRLCFVCIKSGHLARKCKSDKKCRTCGRGGHHSTICFKNFENRQAEGIPAKENNVNVANSSSKGIIMQTINVEARNEGKSRKITLLLDSASQRTYLSQEVADWLGLKPKRRELLTINTFGGKSTKAAEKNIVEINIGKGKKSICIEAIVTRDLCLPIRGQSLSRDDLKELQRYDLADDYLNTETKHIDVIIGLDWYYQIVTGDIIMHDSGLAVISSIFGKFVAGGVTCTKPSKTSAYVTNTYNINLQSDECLQAKLDRFWDVESLGISPNPKSEQDFKPAVSFDGKRYVVGLPWKTNHPLMGDNFEKAKLRLMNLRKKLSRDKSLYETYRGIIEDQLERGIISKVNDVPPITGKTFYMPHRAVIREESATTKVRIVFDASARDKGVSLNDCLCKGESKFTDLFTVLVRARCHQHILIADIEKAFLTVGVNETDRDALRFLFFDNCDSDNPDVIIYRFNRICFGMNASMALLGAAIEEHLGKYKASLPELVDNLTKSLYVDDLTSGADTREEILTMYKVTNEIFSKAGMHLRKWRTDIVGLRPLLDQQEINESEGPPKFAEDHQSYAQTMLNQGPGSASKILGVLWDSDLDTFKMSLEEIGNKGKDMKQTKRTLLALSASIFDPFGFLTPFVIQLKVMFQQVCRDGIKWDDELPQQFKMFWNKWCLAAISAGSFCIPRSILPIKTELESVRLVGFSDASKLAYAAVVYLVAQDKSGKRSSHICCAKSRVAPMATQTIPRLELLGALILSRMVRNLIDILKELVMVSEVVCATDSQVVQAWIKNENTQYSPYVQGRIEKIRAVTDVHMWNHIAGKENPADLPSRGCLPTDMNVQQWETGPGWLIGERADWPLKVEVDTDLRLEEIKTAKRVAVLENTAVVSVGIENLIACEKFSDIKRLCRTTAWVLRFVARCKGNNANVGNTLSADELAKAKKCWLLTAQTEMVNKENYELTKKSLEVFVDPEGLHRCGGRLKRSNINFDSKHPILIPPSHWVTKLLVLEAHEQVFHNKVAQTLAQLRSRYWVVRGRQFIKSVLRQCTLCNKLEGKSYGVPKEADLPQFRINGCRSFQSIGLDYFGPLFVYNGSDVQKVFTVLFTCATSRMIHLEMSTDMTADALIRSLIRFSGRRGCPTLIVSDNQKTFKSKILKSYVAQEGIEWKFNLAKAPWWGGMFERLIKSVKRCLRKSLKNKKLSYEELETVLAQIEGVINSRPITYVGEDCEQILTPSHLHTGYRILDPPNKARPKLIEMDGNLARDAFHGKIHQLENFWKVWEREYVLGLRERAVKLETKGEFPKINDVVVVHQENKRRHLWRLGRIMQLKRSTDGEVRGAMVRVAEKGKRPTIIERPLNKLFPLEMKDGGQVNDDKELQQESDGEMSSRYETSIEKEGRQIRPKRAAAEEGIERRRLAQIFQEYSQ